jgi:hypothetical protein
MAQWTPWPPLALPDPAGASQARVDTTASTMDPRLVAKLDDHPQWTVYVGRAGSPRAPSSRTPLGSDSEGWGVVQWGMQMDDRTDPVQIIARVSERDGRQRAFDAWVHKAAKAGWPVIVESDSTDEPGDECGIVDIEGLRYRIRHAKRVRRRVAIVPEGEAPIAAVVRMTTTGDDGGISWTWQLDHAAWAEPITDPTESTRS